MTGRTDLGREMSYFRSFVNRHEALFTVLAAFIVFAGFFVKEDFAERSRDVRASTNEAVTRFELRSGLAKIEADVEADVIAAIPGGLTDAQMERRLEKQLRYSGMAVDSERQIAAVSQLLLMDLPSQRDDVKEASTMVNELVNRLTASYEGAKKQFGSATDLSHDSTKKRELLDECDASLYKFSEGFPAVFDAIEKFKLLVTQEAARQQESQEQNVRLATDASYVLFILGWGVGLLGKIFHLPVFAQGGD